MGNYIYTSIQYRIFQYYVSVWYEIRVYGKHHTMSEPLLSKAQHRSFFRVWANREQ